MNKYERKHINVKIIRYVVILAILTGVFSGGIGYYSYYTNTYEHYEAYIQTVLELTADEIDGDDMVQCFRTGQPSDRYRLTQIYFNRLKLHEKIASVYLIRPSEAEEIRADFYMSGFTQEQVEENENRTTLATSSWTDFPLEMMEAFRESMELKGSSRAVRFIKNGTAEYGIRLTGYYPITDSRGENIGILCIDVLMEEVHHELQSYLMKVICGTLILTAGIVILMLKRLHGFLIAPIREMALYGERIVTALQNSPSQLRMEKLTVNSEDEIGQLGSSINHMTETLNTYLKEILESTRQKADMALEIERAGQIQKKMIPHTFPPYPERDDFDIQAELRTEAKIRGDFYDFFLVDQTHLCLVAAEVEGEGIVAALYMVKARTLIEQYTRLGWEPEQILAQTNTELSRYGEQNICLKAFLGIMDVSSGVFLYSCGGGQMPWWIGREERRVLDGERGLVMGGLPFVSYKQHQIMLEKGDLLLFQTEHIWMQVIWCGP